MRHSTWRLVSFILLGFTTLIAGVEHLQPEHQYITREAFKLLLKSYPQLVNSEMANYVGTNEQDNNDIVLSFGAFKIVSGAWIEDEYDIVYHYGIGAVPTFNQGVASSLVAVFGDERTTYTSMTHFWNADQGINAPTDLSDAFGNAVKWSLSIENAMQKIALYKNGGYNLRYLYNTVTNVPGLAPLLCLGIDMNYQSLLDLYQNGNYRIVGYLGLALQNDWHPITNLPWIQMNATSRKNHAYEIFGRMCHLLQDMSVPAHVHCVSHACKNGMYCDYYENNALNYHQWTADEVYANGGTYINPYNSWGDPLYYLMYFMNEITDHYATGRADGDDNYDVNCPGLSAVISSLGLPTTQSQINDVNCRAMHDKLFPMVIRATAGLMYWFAVETGQLPRSPQPPFSASISGPTYITNIQTGTYTATASNGFAPYTYQWYGMEVGSGGGVPAHAIKKLERMLPGSWYATGTNSPTLNFADFQNFDVKCVVADAVNQSATSNILCVTVGGSANIAVKLVQNYPNPFNPSTQISYLLPTAGHVSLKVYDVLSREVAVLAEGMKEAGEYTATFDASRLVSGIYFARFIATPDNGEEPFIKTMKMQLIK